MRRWALGMVAVFSVELVLISAEMVSHGNGFSELLRTAKSYMPEDPPPGNGPRLQGFVAELEEADSCYDRGDCDFPHADAEAYRLAVGRYLGALLDELRAWSEANGVRDPRIGDLAAVYLRNPDREVQLAAVALLREQGDHARIAAAFPEGVPLASPAVSVLPAPGQVNVGLSPLAGRDH